MRSSSIALTIGLLAAPLALMSAPTNTLPSFNLIADASAQSRTADTINGHRLEPAPVPGFAPAGVSPVDRVGGPGSRNLDAGPLNGTPFSDTPSGTLTEGGAQTAQSDRVLTPNETTTTTPNLSR